MSQNPLPLALDLYGALCQSPMVAADLKDLTEQVESFLILKDLSEEHIEGRLKDLRARLLQVAEKIGEPTPQGGQRLSVNGHTVTREKRGGKEPELKGLLDLLKAKGIDPAEATATVTTLAVDPSKVDLLIQTGRLTEDEVAPLRKVTWALKVVPSEDLVGQLNEAGGNVVPQPVVETAPRKKRSK